MTIRALIEAVERGELDVAAMEDALSGAEQYDACISAFHGSLDAALALHEALLPGWKVTNLHQFPAGQWVVGVYLSKDDDWPKWAAYPCHEAGGETASRALLLAILRAVEAEGSA